MKRIALALLIVLVASAIHFYAAAQVAMPYTMTMEYMGKRADRVGQLNDGLKPDGKGDGVLLLRFFGNPTGTGSRTLKSLVLTATPTGGMWDSDPASVYWVLGVTTDWNAALANKPAVGLNVAINGDGFTLWVFASDTDAASVFASGQTLNLVAGWGDGKTSQASIVIPPEIMLPPQCIADLNRSFFGPPDAKMPTVVKCTFVFDPLALGVNPFNISVINATSVRWDHQQSSTTMIASLAQKVSGISQPIIDPKAQTITFTVTEPLGVYDVRTSIDGVPLK